MMERFPKQFQAYMEKMFPDEPKISKTYFKCKENWNNGYRTGKAESSKRIEKLNTIIYALKQENREKIGIIIKHSNRCTDLREEKRQLKDRIEKAIEMLAKMKSLITIQREGIAGEPVYVLGLVRRQKYDRVMQEYQEFLKSILKGEEGWNG